jgi:glucose-1-phosphate adenylyltransferase
MYYAAHQDLLRGRIDLDAWGVRTNLQDSLVASQPPARFGPHAEVSGSLVSTGCAIDGEVVGSILSPGVRVERGARVIDSILCHNTVVEAGATVCRTISDKHAVIGAETRCGEESAHGDGPITLIGKHGRLGRGCLLDAGTTVLPAIHLKDGERLEAPR